MPLNSIRLQNFRTYSDESFEFDNGTNIVVGPNASGKTNLLEAVLVLARGRSYRAPDSELVQFDKDWARLDGFFGEDLRIVKVEHRGTRVEKSFELNNKEFKRLNLERTLPIVYFEPNHLQFVIRGPEQRREYFDDLLEQIAVDFKGYTLAYRRALAQRNALLKRGAAQATKQLFVWDVRLSELGAQIAKERFLLVSQINKTISQIYSQISQRKSKVEIFYDVQFPVEAYASKLLHKLENTVKLDLERGFTGHGPHREDLIFYLNGQLVGNTASRGELRTLVLALKIFELNLIEKAREQRPIFLLDDVFSELDGGRRRALVDHLKDLQTIITTTDADAIIEHFTDSNKVILLS